MFSANYGDGRNFQSWSSQQQQQQQHRQQQQQQHRQQQQHHHQAQQLPLKQSVSRQQQQQQQQQQQHQQQKSPPEGLWVDVPNEEDIMHQMSVFKTSNKSHLTPPLDLSEGRRHVESPLDLSVKTRKRCADTTEYGEIVRHNISEATMAKRLCVTREYAYPQGHPSFNQESFPSEKPFQEDPVGRSKLIQQKQLSLNKYSPVLHKPTSQVSPPSHAQHHYAEMQRQQISQQQARQTHLSHQQKSRAGQYGISSAAVSQQMHSAMQKSHVPYESVSTTVKRNPHNMTESVALKGFFEPTQKVTVSATSNQPTSHLPQQSQYQRLPTSDQRVVGPGSRTLPGKSSELAEYEEHSRHPTFPNTAAYQRSVPAVNSNYTLPASTVSGLEQLQQEQLQYQRHLQAQKTQREQMVLFSQLNREKMLKTQEQQQKMAYFMDLQKQTESRIPQTAAQSHFTSRGQHSPYTRQQASATASYQESLRKDRSDFSPARCIRVGQPVPLSDIHQEHTHALEQVHTVQNRPEIVAQQLAADTGNYSSRNKDTSFPSQQAMLNTARMPHTIRYEPTMRYGISKDTNESAASFMARNETSNTGTNLHPSVIQRPQGYIPPRIVRGNGRPSETGASRISMDRVSEPQAVSRYEYNAEHTNRIRQELVARERAGPHKHNDMLSGKEVMKIQQRVAEQRGEAVLSGNGHSKNYPKLSQNRDIDDHIQNTFPGTSGKNSMRRNSLQEKQTREQRMIDYSRSSNEGNERRNSFSKSPSIHSPGSSLSTQKRDNVATGDLQMISLKTFPTERSITKGTSGLKKCPSDMDPFSQFLMRELKKTDDDKSVNPFANRSLLEEFDRSANSSPVQKSNNAQTETPEKNDSAQTNVNLFVKETSANNNSTSNDDSYTVPLQIAIPGHKMSSSVSGAAAPSLSSSVSASSTTRSYVMAGSKSESVTCKNPKMMSRKHMILSAFRQEEDLKNTTNTVNIDQNEKVPMESAKYAARKSDKESNQHGCPTSPKMPILSPQERNRTTPLVSPAVGEPPNLEDSSRLSLSSSDSSKKEINSLEEHLHRLISDAVKGSKNDRESVYETVRRELSSQPQGKVFLSRQLSQNKNIPVANVAPIVHGKSVSDALEGQEKNSATKLDDEFDEEDVKMADIVTRSLFGDNALITKKLNQVDQEGGNKIQTKQENEIEKSDSNLSLPGSSAEALYDENSNSKRLSPGLKKLMLYRHRDNSANSNENSNQSSSVFNEKSKSWSTLVKKEPASDSDVLVKSPKGKGRNVFGAFSEIVAHQTEKTFDNAENGTTALFQDKNIKHTSLWSEFQENDQESIQIVCNTDYDGDDEQVRENQVHRRNKHSNTKQQADRLIKKARHRRNSKQEGDVRSRHALLVKRKSHKGFVDFMPQVLPRRTRSKSSASSSQRRKVKASSPSRRHPKRSSSHELKSTNSPQKTRQRRASSLDRETKSKLSKLKTKQAYFSDNEIGPDKTVKRSCKLNETAVDSDATWHNEDESTDEDYFQNYEDEFKQFVRKNDSSLRFKKASSTKKKKGFHFKQKYIFQRKRRVNKGKARGGIHTANRFGARLDAIYSFHEEGQDIGQFQSAPGDLSLISNIPAPADLKRVTVGKDSGQTVLHRAARMGLEEVALYCLATGSVDVNARDNAGYTALHECALRGRVQIGKHLLTYGADVNCCSTDGIRPIHDAVENDHLEMLRLLLSYGADPTLSTYAGKSLLKIAHSERMLKFIQRYNCDINGYVSDDDEIPWQFRRSCPAIENESGSGCAIFDNLPSDPEDESQDLCTFSSKPLFLTKRLTLDINKRVEDFLLLDDILNGYKMTRSEFLTHGTNSNVRHLIKHIPQNTLIEAHLDSIYYEGFLSKDENRAVEAIRKVDSTQLIAKLEKSSSSKRAKV